MMKRSVQTRLFMIISLLVICFVILSVLINSNFLERYYIDHKKTQLLQNAQQIEAIYNGDPDAIIWEMERLESESALTMLILDEKFFPKYPDYRLFRHDQNGMGIMRGMRLEGRLEAGLDYIKNNRELLDDHDVFAVTEDTRLTINFLNLFTRLDNGDYLVLSTPLSAIEESAAIANRFFFFSGLLTILLGLAAAYFFARRFTEPIRGLNSIAEKMSRLDFSEKYPIISDDEIGELGKSINSLSDQLDQAIGDLTRANQKLQADIEYERSLDEMRKEFVSSVSHELKTPIALIQGYAEGLKLNVNEDEENKNYYCDVITDEARKMNLMVRDLLDLSQYEAGTFKIERTVFDLKALLARVIYKYQPIFVEKGISLDLNTDIKGDTGIKGETDIGVDIGAEALTANDSEVLVDGDVLRMEQVLINYIDNALKYMDDRCQLSISLRCVEDKVRVNVYNSGSPLAEDDIDKVFDSFYKADKARTRSAGGSGLGLSIVRAIQQQHRNAYGVINHENGVEFWFDLDLVAQGRS